MTSSPKKSKRSESKSDNQFHHKLFSILEVIQNFLGLIKFLEFRMLNTRMSYLGTK